MEFKINKDIVNTERVLINLDIAINHKLMYMGQGSGQADLSAASINDMIQFREWFLSHEGDDETPTTTKLIKQVSKKINNAVNPA